MGFEPYMGKQGLLRGSGVRNDLSWGSFDLPMRALAAAPSLR